VDVTAAPLQDGEQGGTHTRLARARVDVDGRVELADVSRHRNAEHTGLAAILRSFLATGPTVETCCLAVAGPTDGRRVRFTNLDWDIDADVLAADLGLRRVRLVNDFAAVGWGLDALAGGDLRPLQVAPRVAGAARVALGAGTGLGVSLCVHDGHGYRPLPTEGGHIGFAPADPEQDRLLAFLRARHGRASLERILSGPGLVDLHRFCLTEAGRPEPAGSAVPDAAAISAAGLDGGDAQAVAALRLFARIYGQAAGDYALATRAEGGVYLAGGIAPRLLPVLESGEFLAGFHAKGRFSDWMHNLPVDVVLDADVGLRGAALAAGWD
jgi:glucokinase